MQKSLLQSSLNLLKKNWLIAVIIFFAGWLRFYNLTDNGILFSDAGRDLLAAKEAVETGELPLLGIPSSLPRFHQGPLTIWLESVVYILFGQQTLTFSIVFAFLGLLAVILVYEFGILYFNKKTALTAATLMAFSPLAIAHSRVAYHTTPIPLIIMIFLLVVQKSWQKRFKYDVFWVTLAWLLALQFELTLFPLGLILLPGWWQQLRKQKLKLDRYFFSQLSLAGLIGLAPQILHDLTQPIAQNQIINFILWIGYRVVSATGLIGGHQLSGEKLIKTGEVFHHYLSRVFSFGPDWIAYIFMGLILFSALYLLWEIWQSKKLSKATYLISACLLILTLSYFIHSSPSEAYFPPFLPLLSLFIGWGANKLLGQFEWLRKKLKIEWILGVLLGGWAIFNTIRIFQHTFFVSNPQEFSYNASIKEQREILQFINHIHPGNFVLRTTLEAGKFEAFFDNFIWLSQELEAENFSAKFISKTQLRITPDTAIFYLEGKDSPLQTYPNITKIEFTTYDLYF